MALSKVTSKFQVTLPADVRAKVTIRAGETVEVEAQDEQTVVIRRRKKMKDPMKFFSPKRPLLKRHIPPDELDELMTSTS
jgi:AbrB family looped-hinge helix DNA binding protein